MLGTLVICVGNEARGDDGVARRVARALADVPRPGVTVLEGDQLDIVMADDVAKAGLVIFVDAQRRETPPVAVEGVDLRATRAHAHGLDPGALLGLAHFVHGTAPEALLLTVAAPQMGHSLELSPTARTAAEAAVLKVIALIEERL